MISLKYKVKRLKPGSTIAALSPSWSGPNTYPTVFEKGIENLKKEFGFKIKEFPHTRTEYTDNIQHAKDRASDINAAFQDKEVEAIFISIGGSDSIRILPYLQQTILTQNPKIVMGFSDSTSILLYLAKLGIPSFHGPSIMAGFSEPEGLHQEFLEHFKSFFFEDWAQYEYPTYTEWTEERYGWTDPNFLNRKKEYKPNSGIKTLSSNNATEGVLIGGCLEVIEMLKGTKYGISQSDWEDTSFFFETSEDKPSPEYVESALISYGMNEAWNGVKNLIVAKPRGYSKEETKSLETKVVSVLRDKFSRKNTNIVCNVDAGHTQPMIIFPLGCTLKILEGRLLLTQSPFTRP